MSYDDDQYTTDNDARACPVIRVGRFAPATRTVQGSYPKDVRLLL